MKHVIYLIVALIMLLYAVPQLQMGQGWSLPTVFGIVWLLFALVVVAAQLYVIFGVDEEKRRELNRIKLMRRWQLEQWLMRRGKQLQMRK